MAVGVDIADVRARPRVDLSALKKAGTAKRALDDFLFFCNFMCGFEMINREEHGEFIDAVEDILRVVKGRRERFAKGAQAPDDYLAIKLVDAAARGIGKTSIVTAFGLRLIVDDRCIAIRFNLNKVDNALLKTEAMGDKLKRGRIPEYYGEFYSAGDWSKDQIKVVGNDHPEDPTVIAGGPDEKQTSTHCDVIFNSDVQDETNSLTEVGRRQVEQWRSAAQQLYRQNSPYRIEVWDTTRHHELDIAGQLRKLALDKKQRFVWSIYRPVADPDEWMKMPDTCHLNFPRLYPREKIREAFDARKSGMREYDVWTQLFLDTSRSVHTKFKAEWLSYPLPYNPASMESVCVLPRRMNLFVMIDPADPDAIQKARERGDMEEIRARCDTGMVLAGMDQMKNRYVLAAVSAQMSVADMGAQVVKWFRAYHQPDKAGGKGPGGEVRNWTMRRVGIEKAIFSGLLIKPLRAWLGDQPAVGVDWAARLCNEHFSAIQISSHKSKAARQDATEVDWASGRVRMGQQQFDIDPQAEHPAQALVQAKKDYPNISKWDVLDAETLMWGTGFMAAPFEMQTEEERSRAEMEKMFDEARAIAEMKPETVLRVYAERFQRKEGVAVAQFGPSEMGWN